MSLPTGHRLTDSQSTLVMSNITSHTSKVETIGWGMMGSGNLLSITAMICHHPNVTTFTNEQAFLRFFTFLSLSWLGVFLVGSHRQKT
jgi:hypothetical protein